MNDDARAAVAERGLVADASAHLTETVAMHLPFESLGPFKTALKKVFSTEDWTTEDAAALSDLVTPHIDEGSWEHPLDNDLTLTHGIHDGRYVIEVTGDVASTTSLFDRVFSGPVQPVATPHPRKVKFVVGGTPAPGVWHRRGEDIDDNRVAALMEDDDITDVMVAGDFVTVGLAGKTSWEDRIDDILARVTELFSTGEETTAPVRTRDDLLDEAGHLKTTAIRPEDLHLMDPDDAAQREVLVTNLGSDDARRRRAAVVTLALSGEAEVASAAVVTGYRDDSKIVKRAAIDAAGDLEDESFRPLFEDALWNEDPWIRWRAVRAIADIGVEPSRDQIALAAADEDFMVRLEAANVFKGES